MGRIVAIRACMTLVLGLMLLGLTLESMGWSIMATRMWWLARLIWRRERRTQGGSGQTREKRRGLRRRLSTWGCPLRMHITGRWTSAGSASGRQVPQYLFAPRRRALVVCRQLGRRWLK